MTLNSRDGRDRGTKQTRHEKLRHELKTGFQIRTQFDVAQDIVELLKIFRSEVGNTNVPIIMILRAFLDKVEDKDRIKTLIKNMVDGSSLVNHKTGKNIELQHVITYVGKDTLRLVVNFIIIGYLDIHEDMITDKSIYYYAEKILTTMENQIL